MNNVTSSSYEDYLISCLSDRAYAATYLETHLEKTASEPELLSLALLNVSEALSRSAQKAEHRQSLDDLLNQPGSQDIQSLANWLAKLGLKLTVTVQEPVINFGDSGNVTHTLHHLDDRPNLKELLTQLQEAIESDTDLPTPDKADLLKQVQNLAEAKQTEEPAQKESLTRKAKKMFEATLKSLPATATIVEASSKLLPLILKALGLPI
ncbi:hypothetical protein [Phormidesmis priestleyi]